MRRRIIKCDENGISLIEVIASILLISIILISFYGMFIQSKKTNVTAESTGDATYFAQTEMEDIYQLSIKADSLESFSSMSIEGYRLESNNFIKTCGKSAPNHEYKLTYDEYSSVLTFVQIEINPEYKSIITIKPLCNFEKSATVIIEVYDKNNVKKAVLENVYFWKNLGGNDA